MIRAQTNQTIGAQMINAADGSAFTGAVTVYVTLDAGTQAIGSVGGGLCTHEGNGYHTYRPVAAETDGQLIAFTFIGSSAIPQTVQIVTTTEQQASALATATGALSITVQQLVTDALQEIRVLGAADVASGEDAQYCVRKLNRLLDNWNADFAAVYGAVFDTFTLTPALQPHTIGPSTATFTATQRPNRIEGANIVNGSVISRLEIRDADWWLGLPNPTLTGATPTDLYYEPTWPNGSIYLWPVPTAAVTLEIKRRVVLGQVALTDVFWMPPGYQDAITLTLAEQLAAPFKVALDPMTARSALAARDRVFGKANPIPRLRNDVGISRRGGFDYTSGRVR